MNRPLILVHIDQDGRVDVLHDGTGVVGFFDQRMSTSVFVLPRRNREVEMMHLIRNAPMVSEGTELAEEDRTLLRRILARQVTI